MRDHRREARKVDRRRRVDRQHIAATDRRLHEGSVQHAGRRNFGLIYGAAGNLQRCLVAQDRMGAHGWLPRVCKARMTALRSNAILNPLSASGRTCSTAMLPAAALVWASNARPANAASVRSSRHGNGATPPAANRAPTILPFSICNAAATDTMANSNDARSRILR